MGHSCQFPDVYELHTADVIVNDGSFWVLLKYTTLKYNLLNHEELEYVPYLPTYAIRRESPEPFPSPPPSALVGITLTVGELVGEMVLGAGDFVGSFSSAFIIVVSAQFQKRSGPTSPVSFRGSSHYSCWVWKWVSLAFYPIKSDRKPS